MESKKPIQEISPEYGSICISDSRFPHAVNEVTDGVRTSLVMFVSTNSEKNKEKVIKLLKILKFSEIFKTKSV